MAENPCCICGKNGEKLIGKRWFCAEHYERATYERRGSWRSLLALVVVLIVFVVAVYALDAVIKPVFTGTTLVLVGIVLALVPAAIWLAFFYQQDRLEPVAGHFTSWVCSPGSAAGRGGGCASAGQGLPGGQLVVYEHPHDHPGQHPGGGFHPGIFKVRREVQCFITQASSTSPPMASSMPPPPVLAMPLLLIFQFVLANGGVDLGSGVIAMAIVALAQASFAGITGYFLGRANSRPIPIWWMPAGVTLAAVADGLFNWLRGRITHGHQPGRQFG